VNNGSEELTIGNRFAVLFGFVDEFDQIASSIPRQ